MASCRSLLLPIREVAFQSQRQVLKRKIVPLTQTRFVSNGPVNSKTPEDRGANEGQLPHVTEEQAAMDKSMGETPPDIGQGTPVQEVCCEPQPTFLPQDANRTGRYSNVTQTLRRKLLKSLKKRCSRKMASARNDLIPRAQEDYTPRIL